MRSFLDMDDNPANWPGDVSEAVGRADAPMVSVDDSCHTLSHEQVARLAGPVKPQMVVLIHYKIPGLNPDWITL